MPPILHEKAVTLQPHFLTPESHIIDRDIATRRSSAMYCFVSSKLKTRHKKQNSHTDMELYPPSTMKIQWHPTPRGWGQSVLFEVGQPTLAYHSLRMQRAKVTPSTQRCACLAAFTLLLVLKKRSCKMAAVSWWIWRQCVFWSHRPTCIIPVYRHCTYNLKKKKFIYVYSE